MTTYWIELEPTGRRVEVPEGKTILEAAQLGGVDLVAACGGVGICGTCRVRATGGGLTPPNTTELAHLTGHEIAAGWRLACQARPLSDVRLEIPPESLPAAQRIQMEGRETRAAADPAVTPFRLEVEPPSLLDLRDDYSRVTASLTQAGIPTPQADLGVLRELSEVLRQNGWWATLALGREAGVSRLVACLPPGQRLLGLAADLGTTKLAVYLVDLESGATLAQTGVMNPQIGYGEDVISRIAFANGSSEQRHLLVSRLAASLNETVRGLCAQTGDSPRQVVDAVIVGNTAMHHFLLGLAVEQLGAAPYVAAVSQALDVRAADIGLELAPGASVHLPANIAGFVGGDHTAALLSSLALPAGDTWLLADIGTNTEISLGVGDQILTCSCASGPAFEGAHIRDGMRAAPGAVERVHIRGEQVELSTIAGKAPVGICGSGILQAVAEMTRSRVLDERGVFHPGHARVRAAQSGGQPTSPHQQSPSGRRAAGRYEFVLAPAELTGHGREILVTRGDVHEIQLAKGAIRAGIEILLDEAGLGPDAVQHWIIAGAFGTYLDLESALRVGMFPRLPLDRFHQVGNAAGSGAKAMLISRGTRTEAARLITRTRYIELTTHPDFTRRFVEAMYFS